jgi:threonine/homoserine/homoserine lactone efflux protein
LRVHLDVLAGFVAFGVVAAATPGPNNLMLMTSGVKFGCVARPSASSSHPPANY